jgi:acetaldehyde dehydrogenase (acetylating)
VSSHPQSAGSAVSKDDRSVAEARELAERAYQAFLAFQNFTQEQVDRIVAAMAAAATANAEKLARMAVEECGFGIVEHKIQKNLFASQKVYEAIRDLKTVGVVGEDRAQGMAEIAVPVGVVAAVLPTTNPTSTAIYKTLIALKGRNTIILSPHPNAMRCTCEAVGIMRDAAIKAGAPPDAICCFSTPTMAGTQELMRHKRTSVILATGGMGMVRAAYSSGKPAFGVGPGNVPAFIDRSADVNKAVADVVFGKTFDNGTICSSEQALVAEEALREPVTQALFANGAYFLSGAEMERLGREMVDTEKHTIAAKYVGQSARRIAELAGINVPENTRVLVAHLEGVGRQYPLSAEKLSPVLALYFAKDRAAAFDTCFELLRFGGLGHTCAIHARDEAVVREYGLRMPAARVVVNSPAPLGSIGMTTNLQPALTLGCGAIGGNITSDNIGPLHLVNLRRVAWGQRSRPAAIRAEGETPSATAGGTPALQMLCPCAANAAPTCRSSQSPVAGRQSPEPVTSRQSPVASEPAGSEVRVAVARAVERFLSEKRPIKKPAVTTPAPQKIEGKPGAKAARMRPRAVEFVSEAEIRAAVKRTEKIVVGKRTIITPAARDLAAEYDVLILEDQDA